MVIHSQPQSFYHLLFFFLSFVRWFIMQQLFGSVSRSGCLYNGCWRLVTADDRPPRLGDSRVMVARSWHLGCLGSAGDSRAGTKENKNWKRRTDLLSSCSGHYLRTVHLIIPSFHQANVSFNFLSYLLLPLMDRLRCYEFSYTSDVLPSI